jgi:hypothetical protein
LSVVVAVVVHSVVAVVVVAVMSLELPFIYPQQLTQ